ncbi:MAG: hypothetical protein NZ853_10615 [Leptospiraceae bacterium]|nr:hypothetical protein [Leptospiraceae bacterium]MDW7977095.1 hypothetical protein [Leptospiraceae bacterium]
MKKRIVELEFFKGKLKLFYNQLLESEKHLLDYMNSLAETKNYLREFQRLPVRTYTKIQIQNLTSYIQKMEILYQRLHRIHEIAYRKIEQLQKTEILDFFSPSVETHVVEKLKKNYLLKNKNIKIKESYFIFKIASVLYCVHGRWDQALKFEQEKELLDFLKNKKEIKFLFPDPSSWKYYFSKGHPHYMILLEVNVDGEKRKMAIFTNEKVVYKEKILDLKLKEIPRENKEIHSFFSKYFFYKGKKIYFFSPSD